MAANQTLTDFVGDDIKHMLIVPKLDLTGIAVTFEIAPGPQQPAILTPACTLPTVITGDDGLPSSIVQVFAAAADVRTAIDALGGLSGDASLTLYYQLRVASIPGELGAAAITTLLYGDYVMKGEANG